MLNSGQVSYLRYEGWISTNIYSFQAYNLKLEIICSLIFNFRKTLTLAATAG